MTKITLSSILQLALSPRATFNLALATNIGSGIWVSFIGGVIMYKNLPRQTFGNVQRKLFPAYFKLTSALSTVLLGLHLHLSRPLGVRGPSLDSTFVLPLLLSSMALSSIANLVYVGPKATEIMLARHAQEAVEKKPYNAIDVSQEMKSLNKRFAKTHALSSSLNLFGFLLPSIFTGLWIGEFGLP